MADEVFDEGFRSELGDVSAELARIILADSAGPP